MKYFLMEDKAFFESCITNSIATDMHTGNAKRQAINNTCIDLVCPEYSGFNIRRVQQIINSYHVIQVVIFGRLPNYQLLALVPQMCCTSNTSGGPV